MSRFQQGFVHPAAAAGGFPTVAFVDSAVSTGATITIPAGASAGDFAVLCDFAREIPQPLAVTPTGFTNRRDDANSTTRGMISSKILVADDPGATITGMAVGIHVQKVMFVFSGGITAVAVNRSAGVLTLSDPNIAVLAVAGLTLPLVCVSCVAKASAGPATFTKETPALTAKVASARLNAGYHLYNSSPADQDMDMADQGTNWLASIIFELS